MYTFRQKGEQLKKKKKQQLRLYLLIKDNPTEFLQLKKIMTPINNPGLSRPHVVQSSILVYPRQTVISK